MGYRRDFSWYDSMPVTDVLEAIYAEAEKINDQFRREYVRSGIATLIDVSKRPVHMQDAFEKIQVWKVIQPELRARGILRPFDTPAVRAKIIGFLKT